MLQITVLPNELWDEEKQEFVYVERQTLRLEHSLVSLAKWEAKWNKPFLTKEEKTKEEVLDYIRCMTITQNVKPEIYMSLTDKNLDEIYEYMNAPMTATTFSNVKNGKRNIERITAEIIYYWIIALNIPFECQKWHLNRLFTLITVCSIKNQPSKKRSMREIMQHNTALNAARRAKLHSMG